jgi:hypothetical protein
MRHIPRVCLVLVLAVAVMLVAGPGRAAAQTPGSKLPGFSVLSPAGERAASGTLSTERQWLLVYLDPVTAPNARLVGLLKEWQTPQLLSRVVLVVEGNPTDVKKWLAKELGADAPPFAWFADADGSAAAALNVAGTPAFFGVKGGTIDWALTGVLSRVESLESIVRTWVEMA